MRRFQLTSIDNEIAKQHQTLFNRNDKIAFEIGSIIMEIGELISLIEFTDNQKDFLLEDHQHSSASSDSGVGGVENQRILEKAGRE